MTNELVDKDSLVITRDRQPQCTLVVWVAKFSEYTRDIENTVSLSIFEICCAP